MTEITAIVTLLTTMLQHMLKDCSMGYRMAQPSTQRSSSLEKATLREAWEKHE